MNRLDINQGTRFSGISGEWSVLGVLHLSDRTEVRLGPVGREGKPITTTVFAEGWDWLQARHWSPQLVSS